VPVRIVYFQSSQDGRGRSPWRKAYAGLMRRWIDRHATDIMAVSEGALSAAWRPDWRDDPRCQVIYQGVEASRFKAQDDPRAVRRRLGVADDAPLYIHVGRITEAKNHPRLVEVFAAVRDRQPHARLLVVGRGEQALEEQLRRRVGELRLDESVIMCGERNDIPRLLAAADVMIFPSLWEGLPGAVLEACASGMPVVASQLPSIGEIAQRVPRVRCVSLSQSNEDWAAAIQAAFQARHGRAEAAREFARSDLTVESLARRTCRVWSKCREAKGVAA
jgi:glycosyltransferase involved in cell wall biosynthesis